MNKLIDKPESQISSQSKINIQLDQGSIVLSSRYEVLGQCTQNQQRIRNYMTYRW